MKVVGVRESLTPVPLYTFYMMDITLKEGRDLVIKDSCGKTIS